MTAEMMSFSFVGVSVLVVIAIIALASSWDRYASRR